MDNRIKITDLNRFKTNNEAISVLTAYDCFSAQFAQKAGIDLILVGDSLGTVIQGRDNTLSVTLDDMIYHTEIVSRVTDRPMIISDMPFLSYQVNPEEALTNAGSLIQDGGAQVVKLEGGRELADTVEKIVTAGIPVCGHLGLRPQSYLTMGGYKVQGRNPEQAKVIVEDAKILEESGAALLVLEGIPSELAQEITQSLTIPTIGIGAGVQCDGQVLVFHDLLGFSEKTPKFVKKYSDSKQSILEALEGFVSDVKSKNFPEEKHCYTLSGPRLVK